MNLPNKLTVSRFVLTALFLWALFSPIRFNDTLALFFFCIAGFTDFLDGRIARKRNLITNFGILMDPLADKILVCSAFIAFVESSHMNPNAPAGSLKGRRAGGRKIWQTQDDLANRHRQRAAGRGCL
jgi:CDP-diacylglycerol--glycerol-3-phosphate 3-phosphatidyltransferase